MGVSDKAINGGGERGEGKRASVRGGRVVYACQPPATAAYRGRAFDHPTMRGEPVRGARDRKA